MEFKSMKRGHTLTSGSPLFQGEQAADTEHRVLVDDPVPEHPVAQDTEEQGRGASS